MTAVGVGGGGGLTVVAKRPETGLRCGGSWSAGLKR